MKQLSSWLLLAFLLVLSSACLRVPGLSTPAPAGAPEPTRAEKKLQKLLSQYPELSKPDTITVRVPYAMPQVAFQTQYVPQHDTIYLQQEASQLDTLISKLETSLDSAQRAATRAKLQQLLVGRPVLRDTLCFDTLGVSGKIWLTGRTYHLQITRATIRDTVTARVGLQKLRACPPAAVPHFAWYNPAGWPLPWWSWLLIGLVGGLLIAVRLRA